VEDSVSGCSLAEEKGFDRKVKLNSHLYTSSEHCTNISELCQSFVLHQANQVDFLKNKKGFS